MSCIFSPPPQRGYGEISRLECPSPAVSSPGMLSPRSQRGLEAKIFGLGLVLTKFCPRGLVVTCQSSKSRQLR